MMVRTREPMMKVVKSGQILNIIQIEHISD